MKTIPTYTATIYVGTREQYTPQVRNLEMAREWLQEHVNSVGLCVTITPTEYLYTNGSEPGFSVGLINYPRFPATPEQIRDKALRIARELLHLFKQSKVTIVCSDNTYMVGQEDLL